MRLHAVTAGILPGSFTFPQESRVFADFCESLLGFPSPGMVVVPYQCPGGCCGTCETATDNQVLSKGHPMDSLRSVTIVSVAELLLLGTFTPELTDSSVEEATHRRQHGRAHVTLIGQRHSDLPVIFNWLNNPPESSQT